MSEFWLAVPSGCSFCFLGRGAGAMKGAYQMTAFEIGQVKAHMYHGLGATEISRILVKPDGKSHWSDTAVQNQIDKLEADPSWKGARQECWRKCCPSRNPLVCLHVLA